MITLERVTKRYGSLTAVDRVDLEIPSGTLFGVLGPNGAGKTTLVRMVGGILRPDEGRIRIAGLDVQAQPEAAKTRLGFIPDRPYLYEKLTGAEFLRFVAGLYGLDGRQVESRIDEFLELWELAAWRDELVETYSHGMRQRLVIASALIHHPEVLAVDEPIIGLDPKGARLLKRIFREFVRRGGTILMCTHSLGIAEALCDRIAIMQEGRIRVEGTMADLRRLVESGDVSLEEVFLRLTGGEEAREIVDVVGE